MGRVTYLANVPWPATISVQIGPRTTGNQSAFEASTCPHPENNTEVLKRKGDGTRFATLRTRTLKTRVLGVQTPVVEGRPLLWRVNSLPPPQRGSLPWRWPLSQRRCVAPGRARCYALASPREKSSLTVGRNQGNGQPKDIVLFFYKPTPSSRSPKWMFLKIVTCGDLLEGPRIMLSSSFALIYNVLTVHF